MATAILTSGGRLGTYRLEDLIAVGDVAAVYRAQQISLGRTVALQVLTPQAMDDPSCRERFQREGRLLARLDHPSVLTVHDFGEADGLLYIAMRLVDGTTLAERMRDRGLSADEAVSILGSIASALDAAHAIGLVHRNVRPDNVLLDARAHAHLAYFGLGSASIPSPELTRAGGVLGSVHYCTPEQIRGEEPHAASDVYSLTAVLYECLTGEVPYPRDSEDGVMGAHLHDRPPKLLGPTSVAAELNHVIARGMAKRPRHRYAQAGELIQAAAAATGRMSAGRRWDRPPFPARPEDGAAPLASQPQGVDGPLEPQRDDWLDGPVEPERDDWPPTPERGGPAAAPSGARDVAALAPRRSLLGRSKGTHAGRPTSGDVGDGGARRDAHSAIRGIEISEHRDGTGKAILRASIAIAAAMAVAVAAAAALLAILAPAASRPESARSGPLTVAYRPPWRTSSDPDAAASALRAPILLRSGDSTLAAGFLVSSSPIPAGPPPRFESRFGAPSSETAVLVAGWRGMRYVWHVTGRNQVVAQVLATAAADISIVCSAPAAATRGMDACLALAARAKLADGSRILPPGTRAGIAARLAAALRPAVSARLAARTGLGAIPLPHRKAIALLLASADQRSAALIDAAAIPSRDRSLAAAVASALRGDSRAFSALAAASAADDRDAYARARSHVHSMEAVLIASVASLGSAGFSVPAPEELAIPAAPPVPRSAPNRHHAPPHTRTRAVTRHHVLAVHSPAHSGAATTGSGRTTQSVTSPPTSGGRASNSTTPAAPAPPPVTTTPAATTPAQITSTTSTSTSSTSTASTSSTTTTTAPAVTTPRPHTPTRHSGGGQTISGSGSV